MRNSTAFLLIITMLVLAAPLLAAGCTSGPGASVTPSPTPDATVLPSPSANVTIMNMAFIPGNITIPRGGAVAWTNLDTVNHGLRFNDSDSPVIGPNGKYSRTFNETGAYNYTCYFHSYMAGSVVVT